MCRKRLDLTRDNVYKLIEGERAYQNAKWPEDPKEITSQKQTPLHFVVYMQEYLNNAVRKLTDTADPGYTQLLDNIRKVTTLGVAAMEKFGAPAREGF